MRRASSRGFTLIEAAIACAVMAIVLAAGGPRLLEWKARQRVASAGQALVNDLQHAREIAVQQHRTVYLSFHDACYVVATTPDCPCDGAPACSLKRVAPEKVSLTPSRDVLAFEPRYGSTVPGEVARFGLGPYSTTVETEAVGRADARLSRLSRLSS